MCESVCISMFMNVCRMRDNFKKISSSLFILWRKLVLLVALLQVGWGN